MKIINTDHGYISVAQLELGDIIWRATHNLYTYGIPLYLNNKTCDKIEFDPLLPSTHVGRAYRVMAHRVYNAKEVQMNECSLIRLSEHRFVELKEAMLVLDCRLKAVRSRKVSSDEIISKVITVLAEPSVAKVLAKYNRGKLNLTSTIQKRIGFYLQMSLWKTKSGYKRILDLVYEPELATVLMEPGMTTDRFNLRILDYVGLYEQKMEIQSKMRSIFSEPSYLRK